MSPAASRIAARLTALTGWRPKRSLDHIIADVIADQARRLGISSNPAHQSAVKPRGE